MKFYERERKLVKREKKALKEIQYLAKLLQI